MLSAIKPPRMHPGTNPEKEMAKQAKFAFNASSASKGAVLDNF